MRAADDLRALSAAATRGPWEPWGVPGSYVHIWTGDERVVARDVPSQDAELIVWLVNRAKAIADLIDAVREMRVGMVSAEGYDCLPPSLGDVRCVDAALAALDADA